MAGFSESLSKEVGALGIKVTLVEPGPFRTDWAGRSLQSSPHPIDAYAETVDAHLSPTIIAPARNLSITAPLPPQARRCAALKLFDKLAKFEVTRSSLSSRMCLTTIPPQLQVEHGEEKWTRYLPISEEN